MSTDHSYFSPADKDDEACVRTCAVLCIYPESLTHQEVSRRLGICPTEAGNRGDRVASRRGGERTINVTHWILSSEGTIQSRDLRRHLDWLTATLKPAEEALRSLQKEAVKMVVRCPWWSNADQAVPILWPEQMYWLSRLNLECEFDIQFWPDDEEVRSDDVAG